MVAGTVEDRDWQRLDKWMWCARFLKARADCARLVSGGLVRLNRQATDKPHARVRPGDVLTLPLRGDVVVVRVVALAARRGPALEARALYTLQEEGACENGCAGDEEARGGREEARAGREEARAGLRDVGIDCISGEPRDARVDDFTDQESRRVRSKR